MAKFVQFTDYDDCEWRIPAHYIAKVYAHREGQKAGTVSSGLYHNRFYQAHHEILVDDTKLLDFALHENVFPQVTQYAQMVDPVYNLGEIFHSDDSYVHVVEA